MKIHRAMAMAAATAVLAVSGCSSSDESTKAAPASAPPRSDVELKGAVLIANTNGSATLSATIVNHSAHDVTLNEVAIIDPDDRKAEVEYLTVFTGGTRLAPGSATHVGDVDDPILIRRTDTSSATSPVQLWLDFDAEVGPDEDDELPSTKVEVPVVPRTADHADVAGEAPNTRITVEDAVIVVVPGQEKAYVGGNVVSEIDDVAYSLPTAVDATGKKVRYRHQTATGGPYGMSAQADQPTAFGGPPYRVPEAEQLGDADYFDAADVTVGETITVTIPFQSGDVIARFKVIAG